MKTAIMLVVVAFLLAVAARAQEVCKHCPSPAQMNLQFGDEPREPRQKIFTPLFVGVFALHALAISTDAFITLKRENPHTCLEGQNGFSEFVHGPELAAEGAVEFGFGLTLGVLMHRAHLPRSFAWLTYMTPAVGIPEHIVGATRWYRNCH